MAATKEGSRACNLHAMVERGAEEGLTRLDRIVPVQRGHVAQLAKEVKVMIPGRRWVVGLCSNARIGAVTRSEHAHGHDESCEGGLSPLVGVFEERRDVNDRELGVDDVKLHHALSKGQSSQRKVFVHRPN
jgi:hypothetical protein